MLDVVEENRSMNIRIGVEVQRDNYGVRPNRGATPHGFSLGVESNGLKAVCLPEQSYMNVRASYVHAVVP